jgi:hypothetical protein
MTGNNPIPIEVAANRAKQKGDLTDKKGIPFQSL